MTPWQVLGVERDVGVADLRRRYAALIKEFRPETHPQDFARVREAYEVALPWARQREAMAAAAPVGPDRQAATTSGVAGSEPPPLPTPQSREEAAEPPPAAEAAIAIEQSSDESATHAGPDLALRFQRLHALAEAATGPSDEALLPELRALLRARGQASLDDSQGLEFALMRWFLESRAPAMTLLFETGRAFDWHRHEARLSAWLSPPALRQMERLLSLSRDLVYARHFSGNPWLRRLHSPRPHWRPVVFRPSALEALSWAERWRHASEDTGVTALADRLDTRTSRCLRGFATTDLWVGAIVATTASDLATAAVGGAIATASVFAARRGLHAAGGLPPDHWTRRTARRVAVHGVIAAIVAVALAGGGIASLVDEDAGPFEIATGCLLVLPVCLLGAALLWRFAAWVELAVASAFQWREAVDRLEFDRCLRSPPAPEPDGLFGRRLGVVQRLRSVRAALRLQAAEVARRARPPRPKPFALVRLRSAGLKTQPWRVAWFAAWVLLALIRLVHGLGHGH